MATAEAAAVGVLVDRYARARQRAADAVQLLLRRQWALFVTDPDVLYDDQRVAGTAAALAATVRAGQIQAAGMSGQFQRQTLASLGQRVRPARFQLPAQPRGIDPVQVWQRPAARFRYLRSLDTPIADALEQATTRLQLIAEDDLSLAERAAATAELAAHDIDAYRRVIRPELSTNGSCGLCAAASHRIYKVSELLPVHERCKCVVVPIARNADPGSVLNRDDLARLYEQAGSTAAADLKRIRFTVQQHGELGPVLRDSSHRFRGPGQVEDDRRAA